MDEISQKFRRNNETELNRIYTSTYVHNLLMTNHLINIKMY